ASQLQPNGKQDRNVRYTHDAAGRLVFTVDSQGAVSENRYDANDNAIASISYANTIALSGLPATANTISTDSVRALLHPDAANDQRLQQVFDANGRVRYSIDSLGYVKAYSYDTLGRLVSATTYAKALP
ncbi:hypothetical protein ACO0K9_28060, partial [Undibacterium sp. Ji50W]|uniref:hypothetical protein n=1 Tax=Undibacterium sp. Ji50W TaxID=3413041 RepID=UPI003BF1F723